jgi:hypothetical protein
LSESTAPSFQAITNHDIVDLIVFFEFLVEPYNVPLLSLDSTSGMGLWPLAVVFFDGTPSSAKLTINLLLRGRPLLFRLSIMNPHLVIHILPCLLDSPKESEDN